MVALKKEKKNVTFFFHALRALYSLFSKKMVRFDTFDPEEKKSSVKKKHFSLSPNRCSLNRDGRW